ncbi:short-chain dehydrogenase [Aliidiomarina taiwanensis]|uniref:Short-chain dehydrogenase n=1 Tax=Aliidiomarina taiwanensis TaxID=946228 RepID=A0A432X9N0_9GAMM|nr:SDR family NAD(P)-dependent oxidoreductase [Aliidiomarina taiwanensis]RUO44016.1 short-chain dehydrogenase [Aliidiomarina taiwanensis]
MKVLITGATSGIGRQLVADYLAAGETVYACGRSEAKLQSLQEELQGQGQLHLVPFDVTDHTGTLIALRQLSEIDCVILSAGVCEYIDEPSDIQGPLFQRVFAANYFGVVNCVEGIIPQLSEGARLVIIDSMARLFPFTRAEAYASSKAAVHYLANTLKVDLAPAGVQVISVSPGFVSTPMTSKNDFAMPMQVTAAEASNAIRSGIEKGKHQIYFPRLFGFIMRMLNALPLGLQLYLSKRMKKG